MMMMMMITMILTRLLVSTNKENGITLILDILKSPRDEIGYLIASYFNNAMYIYESCWLFVQNSQEYSSEEVIYF